jgi:hypothetical protein
MMDPNEKTPPPPIRTPSFNNSHGSNGRDNYAHTSSINRVKYYLATRLTSLAPPVERIPNPFHLLRLLNTQQWLFFLVAFLGWTWNSYDFFTVTLVLPELAKTFGRSQSDITRAITLVLMLRSVGAIIFGIAIDRYGRKWPFNLYVPRVRDRVCDYVPPVLGGESALWGCNGRVVWKCGSYR